MEVIGFLFVAFFIAALVVTAVLVLSVFVDYETPDWTVSLMLWLWGLMFLFYGIADAGGLLDKPTA